MGLCPPCLRPPGMLGLCQPRWPTQLSTGPLPTQLRDPCNLVIKVVWLHEFSFVWRFFVIRYVLEFASVDYGCWILLVLLFACCLFGNCTACFANLLRQLCGLDVLLGSLFVRLLICVRSCFVYIFVCVVLCVLLGVCINLFPFILA